MDNREKWLDEAKHTFSKIDSFDYFDSGVIIHSKDYSLFTAVCQRRGSTQYN